MSDDIMNQVAARSEQRSSSGWLAARCCVLLGVVFCSPPACSAGPADSSALSKEEIAAIRQAVEHCGRLQCDDTGQPIAVDLATGRGSADTAAFQAAMLCPGLKTLRVRAGQIAGDELTKIASLTSLEELMLQDAKLDDLLLRNLARRLRGLQRLTLRNTPLVTDRGIAALEQLPSLSQLALVDLQITGQVTTSLAKSPSLVSLDLRMCKSVPSQALQALGDAPLLRELKLGHYGIDDAALTIVADLPHLQSLTVEDASIRGEGLAALASNQRTAERIHTLSFARCASIDDDALRGLALFPRLRRLSLRDLPVRGSFLAQLPSLGQMEMLSLNELFLDENAFDALTACRKLKRLELAQSLLTAGAMEKIGALSDLEYLNLSGCGLDDTMLESLAGLKKLKTLLLDDNPDVSRTTVESTTFKNQRGRD